MIEINILRFAKLRPNGLSFIRDFFYRIIKFCIIISAFQGQLLDTMPCIQITKKRMLRHLVNFNECKITLLSQQTYQPVNVILSSKNIGCLLNSDSFNDLLHFNGNYRTSPCTTSMKGIKAKHNASVLSNFLEPLHVLSKMCAVLLKVCSLKVVQQLKKRIQQKYNWRLM